MKFDGLAAVLLLSLWACGNTAREAGPEGSSGSAGAAGSVGDAGSPPTDNEAGSGGDGNVICEPGARRCAEETLYECDANGTTELVSEICDEPNTFCIDDPPGSAACVQSVCEPGTAVCFANAVKVCNDQWQYPEQGSECGEQTCFDGECLPIICEFSAFSCQDGDIYACANKGTAFVLSKECSPGKQCFDPGIDVACQPDPCDHGSTACLGNQLGTCDDDGGALSSVAEDCAAEGLVCSLDLVCAQSVVDIVAGDGALFPVGLAVSWLLLNAIDVHADRLVTLLEAPLVVEEAGELIWLIYEWEGDGYVLRVEDTTQAAAGDAVYASNPLSHELKAGRRYLLGVNVPMHVSAYSSGAPSSTPLSFGRVWGGFLGSGFHYDDMDAFDLSSSQTQLRITTELPPP